MTSSVTGAHKDVGTEHEALIGGETVRYRAAAGRMLLREEDNKRKASFFYVAVIWLSHHQAFVAIRRVDKGVHIANLLLLFTTALMPFPTAVLSGALITGVDSTDARTAVATGMS